ncbi:Nuclear pore complex protein Nup205 [Nymphon striatum]|nr:Nuclear pore complex protein Nup205 [Nymphon striatum]
MFYFLQYSYLLYCFVFSFFFFFFYLFSFLILHQETNSIHRDAVKAASTNGISIIGQQGKQVFPQQLIDESLILSDMFQLNELTSLELLISGEQQLSQFPGLTRGLVAVLLYYDGRRVLVNALRTLMQARDGHVWTLGLSNELVTMVTRFTDQLIEGHLISTLLEQIQIINVQKEIEALHSNRALGNPKHRKQVFDLLQESKQSLADCIFCVACQSKLSKTDSLVLLEFLAKNAEMSDDGKFSRVTITLLMSILYAIDVSILQNIEDTDETMKTLTILQDETFVPSFHKELSSLSKWQSPSLKAIIQLGWSVTLRTLSQYPYLQAHTVPAIYRQGKRKAFNMVHINREYDLLDTFTNNGSTHDKVKRAGETFVLKLHGASNFESLDKYSHIAYKMAIGRSSLSSSFQLANLPPTSAAAKQHACHTHIPVQEWMDNTLPPTEWGWRSRDGILGPVETDMPVAPDYINQYIEEDENIVDTAIENNVFSALMIGVIDTPNFHNEEFYLKKIHGLITDFLILLPLKVKELRNRGDEAARIIMAHQQEGLQPPVNLTTYFHDLMLLIAAIYEKDPLKLELASDYWYSSEPVISVGMTNSYSYGNPQKQVALFKFVRLSGDLLPPSLYMPHVKMLTSLANASSHTAHLCYNLLKMNGISPGGKHSTVSWDHFFSALHRYYSNLRQETMVSSDTQHIYRHRPATKGITPDEMDGLITVLELIKVVTEQDDMARIALSENQQWVPVGVLFGLVGCSIPPHMKGQLLQTLSAFGHTSDIAENIWQSLEAAQVIQTIKTTSIYQPGGIQVELDEVESRLEEYPLTRSMLNLMYVLISNSPNTILSLGLGMRAPGFDPYLEFIRESVFLKFNTRAYKDPVEKWLVAEDCLKVLHKLLLEHQPSIGHFVDNVTELQSGGSAVANKNPGHSIMMHLLHNGQFLKKVFSIIDEAATQLDQYIDFPGIYNFIAMHLLTFLTAYQTDIPITPFLCQEVKKSRSQEVKKSNGKTYLEQSALLCLKLIELTLEKQVLFMKLHRESGSGFMATNMEKLLLSINPRTGHADHLINISKFMTYSTYLSEHALTAVNILIFACQSPIIQTQIVDIFMSDHENLAANLLQGFVECIDIDDIEVMDHEPIEDKGGGDDEKKESERAKKQIEKRKADQKSYDKAKRRRLIQESWLEEFTWAVVRSMGHINRDIDALLDDTVFFLEERFVKHIGREPHSLFNIFDFKCWPKKNTSPQEFIAYGDEDIGKLVDLFGPLLSEEEKDNAANHLTAILPIINIMLTISPSTAQCERGFSAMNGLKTQYRTSLNQNSLSHLMRVKVDGPFVKDFNPTDSLVTWINSGKSTKHLKGHKLSGFQKTDSQIRNLTRQHILKLLLMALDHPSPNLSHFLLGFQINKPIEKTNLQDPGVLGAPQTCFHAILYLLDNGLDTSTHGLPPAHRLMPIFTDKAYQLVYKLCVNRETSTPTLRYLRTTHDFFYKHLHKVPFASNSSCDKVILSQQSWFLKSVAVELRITAANRQRSHMVRLLNLLVDDKPIESQNFGIDGNYDNDSILGNMTSIGMSSTIMKQTLSGGQVRRRLLSILDSLEFVQHYPSTPDWEYFDGAIIEQVFKNCEEIVTSEVKLINIQDVHHVLMTEINQLQGAAAIGQRPMIVEEVQTILKHVIKRNNVREEIIAKKQAFEAWRQVTEIILTACPSDLLDGEKRQNILFEIIQELLKKVILDNDSLKELTNPVAGVILTLLTNLHQSFLSTSNYDKDAFRSTQDQSVHLLHQSHKMSSHSTYSSFLQVTLKGLIECIMMTSGSQQRVRANFYAALLNYLRIGEKDKQLDDYSVETKITQAETDDEKLRKQNVDAILSYGNNFMEVVCRDSTGGHDICKMLALATLNVMCSIDKPQHWLNFMNSKGYIGHLIHSITEDDEELHSMLVPNPALLTRVACTPAGAQSLLRNGIMEKLAACQVFSMRPTYNVQRAELEGDSIVPSAMARYSQILFPSLKLCLAFITSLKNEEASVQVMTFLAAHFRVFNEILSNKQPRHDSILLQEKALLTAILARTAAYDFGTIGNDFARSNIQVEVTQFEHLVFQLLPYSMQLCTSLQDAKDNIKLSCLEILTNVLAYCQKLMTRSGNSAKHYRIFLNPSFAEANAANSYPLKGLNVTTQSVGPPSLGLIVLHMKESMDNFIKLFKDHQTLVSKVKALADLSSDELSELVEQSENLEKLSSQMKKTLAKQRLNALISCRSQELKLYSCPLLNQASPSVPVRENPNPMTTDEFRQFKSDVSRCIGDTLFMKLHDVEKCYIRSHSHSGFLEAVVRRVKRLVKLHTH